MKIRYFLLFILFSIFFYRAFFISGHLVWGDAPYFYTENLHQLFHQPLIWEARNDNFGVNQATVMWLFLPTFLAGLINHFLGLSWDILIRLIFYLPSIALSYLGCWFFLDRFTKNRPALFLGSFLYSFNSYLLLLIDGGQLGVVLAYGLFPWVVTSALKLLEKQNRSSFILFTILLFGITNVDPRIAVLALLTTVPLITYEIRSEKIPLRNFLSLLFVVLAVCLMDSYWLIPFMANLEKVRSIIPNQEVNFVNLLNSLVLFQPHFPNNEFGKISPTPFYYALVPLLIFLWLPFKRTKSNLLFGFLYLISAFLAKGTQEPLPQLYQEISKIPLFGVSFRDSSKFFIPLILFGSYLLVQSFEILSNIKLAFFAILIFLTLLILPAGDGLTGVLKISPVSDSSYKEIYSKFTQDEGFFRSLWYPERPPLAFADWSRNALSANTLYQERPFTSMIEGSYDLFNFLHNQNLYKWYQLLGIKYVAYPDDPRKKTYSARDRIERAQFLSFVATQSGLQKLNLQTNFPIYQTPGIQDHLFGLKKVFLVIGGEDIYDQLFKDPKFNLAANGFIFLDEGKINPNLFFGVDSSAASVIFNHTNLDDLTMDFLTNNFIDPNQASKSQWGYFSAADYLNWKYELLKYTLPSKDFSYGRGIAYSSRPGEVISFKPKTASGKYYLNLRLIQSSGSGSLRIDLNSQNLTVPNNQKFSWFRLGPFDLSNGEQNLEIHNGSGFVALNTFCLIPVDLYNQAKEEAKNLVGHFGSLNDFNQDNIEVGYQMIDPTKYQIDPVDANWLVFTDHYDSGWRFNNTNSLPLYAMVNGFYIRGKNSGLLYYSPQDLIAPSIVISLIGVFLTLALFLKYRK